MDYNNNSNPYAQPNNNYSQNGQGQFIRNPGQTMATISMVLGVISIMTVFTVYTPIICGSIAIILAILSKGYGKKMLTTAKVGIGTAVGGMTLIIALIGSLTTLLLSSSSQQMIEFGRQMDEQFQEQTGMELKDLMGKSYEEIMKEYADSLGK